MHNENELESEHYKIRGEKDLLKELRRGVHLSPIHSKKHVAVGQMPQREKETPGHRDQRDEGRKDHNDGKDGENQGIVVAIEENHSFLASPRFLIVHVLSSVMGKPGAKEGTAYLSRSYEIYASGYASILN